MKIEEAKLQVRNREIWDRLDELDKLSKRENRPLTDEEKEEFYELFEEEYQDKYPGSHTPEVWSQDYLDWLICSEGYL